MGKAYSDRFTMLLESAILGLKEAKKEIAPKAKEAVKRWATATSEDAVRILGRPKWQLSKSIVSKTKDYREGTVFWAMAGFRFREKNNKRDPGYYGKYYEAGWAPNGRKVTVPDHFLRKAKKKNKPRLERELDEAMGDYREMLAEYMRRRNYNQNLKKPK